MKVPAVLRCHLLPPYSMQTVLMLAISLLAVAMVGLNGVISYQRITRDTLNQAAQQASSVARLQATAILEPLIVDDIAAIESTLQQVVQLPGVESLAIVRRDGRLLGEVRKDESDLLTPISRHIGSPGADELEGTVRGEHYVLTVPVTADDKTALGWVTITYSLRERELQIEQLWQRSLNTLALTIGLILIILPFLLRAALRPLRDLSSMAGDLSVRLGHQIDLRSGLLEVDQLARALNKASHDVAAEVARTQIIVNTAAVAIISLDEQGQVISANPATTSIFGREASDLVGQAIDECIPGLDARTLRELFGEINGASGRVYRIVRQDFLGTRMEGTRFPIEITLGQAPDSGDLHYVCIVRDITDERAAQETSELYERALASSHNGVFITNANMASQPIVFVNAALQKITGLAPHEVYGRGLETFLGGSGGDASLDAIRLAIGEERAESVTLHQQLANGRELYAELSLSPVRGPDGRLTNFVGIISDVTARIHAEEAIAERSAQLDAIFSLSPDGFVLFDADGHLIFANPAFERMTGRTWKRPGLPATLEEFRHDLAALCDPDHRVNALQGLNPDGDSAQTRLVLARPQHRVVQTQVRRNAAGRSETILYFRDITHEDEVDRMKSEFLASAAHELRTPMVSIFGFTELLLKRKFSDERRTDMLETIHRQSGLLVKMINELLDLARIESRRGLDLHIAEHPLTELVEHSVKGLMRAEGERQVLVSAIPDVPVLIDPEKMQLALRNLLSNAFKYSPQGGEVTLSARVAEDEGRSYAILEVRDHGIGMTPEQLARAFERFYRADTTGNIPGTGLGLSLVKEVAGLHNGRIELDSGLGSGTTARLWIPMPSRVSALTHESSAAIAH